MEGCKAAQDPNHFFQTLGSYAMLHINLFDQNVWLGFSVPMQFRFIFFIKRYGADKSL